MESYERKLLIELKTAEKKAWKALSGYKFMMFGYWAAVWVHLNRVGHFGLGNPWTYLVKESKKRMGQGFDDD